MTNPALLFADVVDKLKTTVQEGRSFDAAQVRVVGLDDIRAAAGDNWDAMKERVRNNSLNFIQGCVGREDIVIPAGDGFLVLYAEAPDRDLLRESKVLQDALNAFYIGEEGMEKLRSKVKGISVDAKNMHSVLAFEGSDLAFEDDVPVAANDHGVAPKPAAPVAPAAAAHGPGTEHHLMFAPVWGATQQVIATYFVSAAYFDAARRRRHGYDAAYRAQGKLSSETYLDLDLQALTLAVESADFALASGRKCLIGFTVHSTTLRSRTLRGQYLAQLAHVPANLRKYLTIRIAEVEHGTPMITLSEWVGVLRGICPRVSVELHPNEQNFQGLASTGAWAFCCYLPLNGNASPEERRHYANMMGRWAPALRRQNVKFCVDNLVDPVLLEVALRSGAEFITSETVWPLLEAPSGVVAFAHANIAAAFCQRQSA